MAAAASFGTLAIFGKFAYDAGADVLPLLAARFAVTSVLLIGFHLVTRRSLRVPFKTALKLVALGGGAYALEAALFFFALDRAPATVVSLIFFSYPIWTTLGALLTRLEPFHPRIVAALVIGSVGVATIFSIETTDASGPLFAVGAAVAVAGYYLLAQIFTKDVEPATAATWTAVGATFSYSSAVAFTSQSFPSEAIGPAVGLGLATAVSFVLMYAAIARLGSARVAIASMVEPVTTIILAALFLDEELTLRIVIGAAFVVAALPILVSRRRNDRPVAADAL